MDLTMDAWKQLYSRGLVLQVTEEFRTVDDEGPSICVRVGGFDGTLTQGFVFRHEVEANGICLVDLIRDVAELALKNAPGDFVFEPKAVA